MYINNRAAALIFRLFTITGCGYGLASMSNIFGGGFTAQMLVFYTTLSNILVFGYLTASVVHTVMGIRLFGLRGVSTLLPGLKRAFVLMIIITALVYHIVLASSDFIMSFDYGLHSLPDILVHYFTPIMFMLDWLLFDKKGQVKRLDPLKWLILPGLYLIFAVIRAQVGPPIPMFGRMMRYPYPFLDVDYYGLGQVGINVLVLIAGFIFLGYIFYFTDKILTFRNKKY